MKLKHALKKELMFFSRTFRMFGVILSIVIFGFADPIMIKGMGAMMSGMAQVVEEQSAGMDEPIFTEEDLGIFEMFSDLSATDMVSMSVGDFANTSTLIVLLILMGAAGSEQKKRSVIIPRCAGLTSKMYVTPKFIIYPLTGLVSGFVGMMISGGMSALLFEGSVEIMPLLLSAFSVGLYISFIIVLQLTLGLCTAKPGVSVITVLVAASLIPTLLQSFRVDKFNPFALPGVAMSAFKEINTLNTVVSLVVTVIISLILYFTTLFVLTARQIENEGNEAVL